MRGLRWGGPARRALEPTLLDARRGYALWASSYPVSADNGLMAVEERELRRLLPAVAGRAVLDAACGSGRYLARLCADGASPCVGLDLVTAMLARARQAGGLVVQADLVRLPFARATFDLVVCGLAVGHLADLAAAVAEMARVLRPGGALVYSDVHPEGARAGWKRTFRAADGGVYAIRHHIHPIEAHHAACRVAGLEVEALAEPLVEVEGDWRGTPAAVVVRARRS